MTGSEEIAVVGATGVVGRELLAALDQEGHPAEHVTALASDRSDGTEVDYAGETLAVEKTGPESFRGIALALLAVPPDVARTLAPAAQAAGAWVVDVSAAFRGDLSVPLVLPPLDLGPLRAPFKGRIVCCPSPITTALALLLEPLRRDPALGVEQVQLTALVAASSAGLRGISELETQTADLLSGREPEAARFPYRLAFNLVPQVGDLGEGGWTSEEHAWREETHRLWSGGGPIVSGTAIQAPTFYGHTLSLAVKLKVPAPEDRVRAALQASPALKVLDAPAERVYPMPMLVTADPAIHVGRIRVVPGAPGWVLLVATLDNAGRGAALNAVEAGRALLDRARA